MKNTTHKKVIVVFFLGLALMATLELGLIWFFERTLFGGGWQSILALIMIMVGAALVIWSVQTLSAQGQGTPAPMAATQRLVRAGPYRYSRNPMTLGAGLFYLGLAALAGSWIVFGLVLLIFISLLTFIYIHETKQLAERFGVEYLQYRKEIPFLFPRIPR
jgi:protein-S-isoprenylcysteine O-methyltransferase Ste14